MVKLLTTPASNEAIDRAGRAVARAGSELRRGDPVLLDGGELGAWIGFPAEFLGKAVLDRVAAHADFPPMLALGGGRAEALGLSVKDAEAALLSRRADVDIDTWLAFLRDACDPEAPPRGEALAVSEPVDHGTLCFIRLIKQCGLLPMAVLMRPRLPAAMTVAEFADEADFPLLQPGDLQSAAAAHALIRTSASARVPLDNAPNTRIVAFRPGDGGQEHFAIVIGHPDPQDAVPVRIHSACFTGDVLGSLRCDCGEQLRAAVERIARAGSGVILYLAQEGRGIGLVNKLRAYRLQDAGLDTLDANVQLGFTADERSFGHAAAMLGHLGLSKIRLMTNNPDKVAALRALGIDVRERIPHAFPSGPHNKAYLDTKAERFGHFLHETD